MPRVFVLALDGLDWTLLNQFIQEGKLPTFRMLKEYGTYGRMDVTKERLTSPVLWTSVASGKHSTKHGIVDFVDKKGVAVTSNMVKTKRIWEILSDANFLTCVVGWFVTYPAIKINGFMVSDLFNQEDAFYPQEIKEEFPTVNINDKLQNFSPFKFNKYYQIKYRENSPEWVRHHLYKTRFLYVLHRDERLTQFCVKLFKKHSPDLTLLYLQGTDYTSHAFWRFMRPNEFSKVEKFDYDKTSDEDIRYFGKIIEKYYVYFDSVIKDVIDLLNKDFILFVISDHGFQRISEKRIIDNGPIMARFLSGDHSPEAVFMAYGENIKRGMAVEDISIFDIAPTILNIFNMKIGKDMDGKVLAKIFKCPNPQTFTETYECNERGEKEAIETPDNAEIIERLKGLGYL